MTQRCHGIHCICHVDLFKGIGSICMQDATHLSCWSWLKHYVDSENERLGGWGKRVGLHVRTKIFVFSQWAMKFDVQKTLISYWKATVGSNMPAFSYGKSIRIIRNIVIPTENTIQFSKSIAFPAEMSRYTAKCLFFVRKMQSDFQKTLFFL